MKHLRRMLINSQANILIPILRKRMDWIRIKQSRKYDK